MVSCTVKMCHCKKVMTVLICDGPDFVSRLLSALTYYNGQWEGLHGSCVPRCLSSQLVRCVCSSHSHLPMQAVGQIPPQNNHCAPKAPFDPPGANLRASDSSQIWRRDIVQGSRYSTGKMKRNGQARGRHHHLKTEDGLQFCKLGVDTTQFSDPRLKFKCF